MLLSVSVTCLLASCSEDFIVGAPYKPVTVVYGLLNVGDPANYIRIQKAFLDENKSALDLAKIADSSYYDSLEVHMRELSGTTILADEVLRRVDLANEGFPKAQGVFFNTPNYAYKTTRTLNPDYRYRVVIINRFTGETDSAETAMIANTQTKFRVDDFVFGFSVHFPSVYENSKFTLSVNVPDNAQIFEGIIRFHYVEKDAGAGTSKDTFVDWSFASTQRIEGRPSVVLAVPESNFFSFLGDAIPVAGQNVVRHIDTCEVFVWAGSQEFATYQQINGAQGGLTADQIKPIYTNVKGANAYGLLASRAMRVRMAPVDDQSLEALRVKLPKLNFSTVRADH